MPLLLLCLSLLACNKTTGGDSDDDDSTASALGAVGEDSGADDAVDTGYECNPWYPCQECGGGACGDTLSDCVSDSTCQGALNRWAACVIDCGRPSDCADSFAQSGAPAADLLQCVTASCAEECDL